MDTEDNRPQVEWQTGSKEHRQFDLLVWPFLLVAVMSPPEFMRVAFVMLHGGSEEIHIRGKSREHFDLVIAELKKHPRFRRMTITGPNNFKEETTR